MIASARHKGHFILFILPILARGFRLFGLYRLLHIGISGEIVSMKKAGWKEKLALNLGGQ
jgi:hypothetical protein